jgi:alpha-L-rhamnosidase
MSLTDLLRRLILAVSLLPATGWSASAIPEGSIAPSSWITHPAASESIPVVLRFRRELELTRVDKRVPVHVSADNRFILYVNGKRVGAGPTQSDLKHWRYEQLDLAPYLHKGRNVLAAVVWNFVQPPPALSPDMTDGQRRAAIARVQAKQGGRAAQVSAGSGFVLSAVLDQHRDFDTNHGWKVMIERGHTASPLLQVWPTSYYVAGAPESIDATAIDWTWNEPASSGGSWVAATPVLKPGESSPWSLSPSSLPQMRFDKADSGRVARSDLPGAEAFPKAPITIPAERHIKVLIQRDAMISAYPELMVAGGRGARIKVTYAEALYDGEGEKGIRDEIGDRKARGLIDTFVADGERRTFAPLWWRTWRFLELGIQTAQEPLQLEELRTFETGYPFEQKARFESDDAELNRIWQVGWRTALVDAHETYMDSSFWEQLQYVGDTRLQILISYAVSGDPRLAVQALDAFGSSHVDGGLTEAAYPSSLSNIIPPFSLLWIGMLHDYWMQQPDKSVLTRNLGRTREILDWYSKYLQPSGLLRRNPHWNFVDWVKQSGRLLPRDRFPSFDANEESCLTTLSYLGGLLQAAELEQAIGDPQRAQLNLARANSIRDALRARCWDSQRGLFADDPSRQIFSQHANALAILYDVASKDETREILGHITSARGIEAPEGILPVSYYFAWYLIRAHEHAGLADRYVDLLSTWRDMLKLKFTTWPEEPGSTRSDTHAWSAHPTADLLGIVAGIQPAAPGYSKVRISPHLSGLTSLDASAQTPHGEVLVSYRVRGGKLTAKVRRPAALPGVFVWNGREYPLVRTVTRLSLDR